MSSSNQAPVSARALNMSLLVIACAQLILVLDDSIANIALPSIQNELHIAAAYLPWVINAYILAFGGLLLFGGKLGDVLGRRRVLQAGMVLFTLRCRSKPASCSIDKLICLGAITYHPSSGLAKTAGQNQSFPKTAWTRLQG